MLSEILAVGGAGIIVGLIIGIPIAVALFLWTRWRDRKGVPNGQHRIELMEAVHRMAQEGRGYKQRMSYLRSQGLRRNVAEGLIVDVERKQPADVETTKVASQGGLSFQYPGNWRLQDLEEGVDSKTNFSVEGMNSAICIFMVRNDGEPPIDDIMKLTNGQRKQIKADIETPFNRWGPLSGEGRLLRGTIINGLPIETSVFRCTPAPGTTVAVIQSRLDEDHDDAKPGFELIQRTFKLE